MVSTRASTRASQATSDMRSSKQHPLSKRVYDRIVGWANDTAGGSSLKLSAAPKDATFPIERFPSPTSSASAHSSHSSRPHRDSRPPVQDPVSDNASTRDPEASTGRRPLITEADIDSPLMETDPTYPLKMLTHLEARFQDSLERHGKAHKRLVETLADSTLARAEAKQLQELGQRNIDLAGKMSGWKPIKLIVDRGAKRAEDGDDGGERSDDDEVSRNGGDGDSSLGGAERGVENTDGEGENGGHRDEERNGGEKDDKDNSKPSLSKSNHSAASRMPRATTPKNAPGFPAADAHRDQTQQSMSKPTQSSRSTKRSRPEEEHDIALITPSSKRVRPGDHSHTTSHSSPVRKTASKRPRRGDNLTSNTSPSSSPLNGRVIPPRRIASTAVSSTSSTGPTTLNSALTGRGSAISSTFPSRSVNTQPKAQESVLTRRGDLAVTTPSSSNTTNGLTASESTLTRRGDVVAVTAPSSSNTTNGLMASESTPTRRGDVVAVIPPSKSNSNTAREPMVSKTTLARRDSALAVTPSSSNRKRRREAEASEAGPSKRNIVVPFDSMKRSRKDGGPANRTSGAAVASPSAGSSSLTATGPGRTSRSLALQLARRSPSRNAVTLLSSQAIAVPSSSTAMQTRNDNPRSHDVSLADRNSSRSPPPQRKPFLALPAPPIQWVHYHQAFKQKPGHQVMLIDEFSDMPSSPDSPAMRREGATDQEIEATTGVPRIEARPDVLQIEGGAEVRQIEANPTVPQIESPSSWRDAWRMSLFGDKKT